MPPTFELQDQIATHISHLGIATLEVDEFAHWGNPKATGS